MKDTFRELDTVVRQFITDENFSLGNALTYAGLGLSKTTGSVNEIINGVGFGGQQYSPERMNRMAEVLGEKLFHWMVIASTLEISPEGIVAQYISSWEATRVKMAEEAGITLQDMMNMKRHVKPEAMMRYMDEEEKRRQREDLL